MRRARTVFFFAGDFAGLRAGFFFLATVAGARTMYSKCVLLDFLFRVFCCAGREAMDPAFDFFER